MSNSRCKCYIFNSEQLSLIESAVGMLAAGYAERLLAVARRARVGKPKHLLNCCICESKWLIRFNFLNFFKNQTYILAVFNDKPSKVILFWKINRFFCLTTGLDTQWFDQKINYICISRLTFCLPPVKTHLHSRDLNQNFCTWRPTDAILRT